jgi:integrase
MTEQSVTTNGNGSNGSNGGGTNGASNSKHAGGRPRKGALVYRPTQGWCARLTVDVDGEPVRKCFPLGTHDRSAARRKLARMLAEGTPEAAAAEATRVETVASYAKTWFEGREARGVVSAEKERAVFDHYWSAELGPLPLRDVRSSHVRGVLTACAEGETLGQHGDRLKRHTIAGIRSVVLRLFDAAWQDELVSENPVARVKVKALCPHEDHKVRAVLTDAELGVLLGCRDVDPEIKMLVLLSRTVGGMRASDLHALDWAAFGPEFKTLRVPRHKTRHERGAQELDVPEQVRPLVDAWWRAEGSPASGPVFRVRKGPRAGEAKCLGTSYAERLRESLLVAGVIRHVCTREHDPNHPRKRGEPCCLGMATDPLFSETADTLPVDFHSTRRAYCSALARAGVNAQTAQVLAGHSSAAVHQRYVASETIRALPEAAMLALPPAAVSALPLPKLEGGASEKPSDSECRRRESNPRPGAYETPALAD